MAIAAVDAQVLRLSPATCSEPRGRRWPKYVCSSTRSCAGLAARRVVAGCHVSCDATHGNRDKGSRVLRLERQPTAPVAPTAVLCVHGEGEVFAGQGDSDHERPVWACLVAATGAPAIVLAFGRVHLITHEVPAIPRGVTNGKRDVRNVTLDVSRPTHGLMGYAIVRGSFGSRCRGRTGLAPNVAMQLRTLRRLMRGAA